MVALPTCGMTDHDMRRYFQKNNSYYSAACITVVRCCVHQGILRKKMLNGVFEFVSQQMLAHRLWSFQMSGIDILRYLLRLKIHEISESLVSQYLDMVLDATFNTPSTLVKLGALELLQTFMLVFPQAVTKKLEQIRDVLRNLLMEKDREILGKVLQIYPMVFFSAKEDQLESFYQFLKQDIELYTKKVLTKEDLEATIGLNKNSMEALACVSMESIGYLQQGLLATRILEDFTIYLSNPISLYRKHMILSLSYQLKVLNTPDTKSIYWFILPFIADPSRLVRDAFWDILEDSKTELMHLKNVLPPIDSDTVELPER